MRRLVAIVLLASVAGGQVSYSDEARDLRLEAKISLGRVRGRIDHLGIDVGRQRLYVAELGNDSVSVIDLQRRQVIQRLSGLSEPQGIGYVPSSDTLYVANAGDGSVRLFEGASLKPASVIQLGDDADNVRVDDEAHRVFIGYGGGALAVIDTVSRTKTATMALQAHPESFRLEHRGPRIFVNVPAAHEIAVLDRTSSRQISSWKTQDLRANFPLALDEAGQRVFSVFRHPAMVGVFSTETGAMSISLDTCADADDVFFDAKRGVLYVVCGEGVVDVISTHANDYRRFARIPTSVGARTGLFVPELDRLFVAAHASQTQPATIWVFKPDS